MNVWYVPTGGGNSIAKLGGLKAFASRFNLGRIESIDVSGHNPQSLHLAVQQLNPRVVYIEDGQTYYLRHALRKSGGDKLVQQYVAAGCVYVSSSAGSIVAGESIQTAFWKDIDDKSAGPYQLDSRHWEDVSNAQGLNLLAGLSIVPHCNGNSIYGSPTWQQSKAAELTALLGAHHEAAKVVCLADGEGLLQIGGERVELLGAGRAAPPLPTGVYTVRNRGGCPLYAASTPYANGDRLAWIKADPGYQYWTRWQLVPHSSMSRALVPTYRLICFADEVEHRVLVASPTADADGDRVAGVSHNHADGSALWELFVQEDGSYKIINRRWGGPLYAGSQADDDGDRMAWVKHTPMHDHLAVWTLDPL